MTVYFDTSALVKRYAPNEANAATVMAFFATPRQILTSALTQIEMVSAFCIKERTKQLTMAEKMAAINDFELHSPADYVFVQPPPTMYAITKRLLLTYKLRAYDATHIATALGITQIAKISPADLEFYTADTDQAVAARAEGLTVIAV